MIDRSSLRMMRLYTNRRGNSGVIEYAPGAEAIIIRFRNGDTYLYDYHTPGPRKVERMKQLAGKGVGLATFINKHVRDSYAKKLT